MNYGVKSVYRDHKSDVSNYIIYIYPVHQYDLALCFCSSLMMNTRIS